MRRTLLTIFVLGAALAGGGCGLTLDFDSIPEADDGGEQDAGLDARTRSDGAVDADATPRLDGRMDADVPPTDARPTDSRVRGCPAPGTLLEIASADVMGDVAGNIQFSPEFYTGWRFEVPPCGMDLREVGFYGDTEDGRFFAAIVRVPDITSFPSRPDLTGSDVVAVQLFDSYEGFTGDIRTTFAHRLDGGFYAVVFGSGGFGAETARGGIHGGQRRVSGAQLPFTARQSDGSFILQEGEYRLFVVGTAL